MSESVAIAVVALWNTLRFSTWDIAQILGEHEAQVERTIHIWREAKRGVVST